MGHGTSAGKNVSVEVRPISILGVYAPSAVGSVAELYILLLTSYSKSSTSLRRNELNTHPTKRPRIIHIISQTEFRGAAGARSSTERTEARVEERVELAVVRGGVLG